MRNRKLVFATFLALGIATFNACIDDPEPAALTEIGRASCRERV